MRVVAPGDELDARAKQSGARNCEVFDFEGDDRTAPKEFMILVKRTIDVNFGPIAQLESAGLVVHRQSVQIQHVAVERVHLVELSCLDSHPTQPRYFHSKPREGLTFGRMSSLLVKEACFVEAPSSSVVQVEVAVCAEVLAGEELAVGAGHKTRKLFVCEFVELFGGDRLPNPESS